MTSKFIGGVLLVIGTTIGAGMLALPVATAALGFWGALGLLVACWAIMTASALLFLEVNLWLPNNSNLISMAGATLGRTGQMVAWVVYLLLLYSIISAYISGGGDLFHYMLLTSGLSMPQWSSSLLFTLFFGTIVYCGVHIVDYANRGLMFGKLGAFLLLVVMLLPHVSSTLLLGGDWKQMLGSTPITVSAVSFGCIMIIPTLRTYFNGDVKSLRYAIVIGMTIPLLCYIAWDMVIMGVVPMPGPHGLAQIVHSSNSNSDLVATVSFIMQKNIVADVAKFFTSICMVTSFLSVSLSLTDFLADGLRLKKQGSGSIVIFAAAFLPPLMMVLYYPDAFLRGLHYAGIDCIILMILLPALMAWFGRYHHGIAQGYRVKGGKWLLALLTAFATLMIGQGIA